MLSQAPLVCAKAEEPQRISSGYKKAKRDFNSEKILPGSARNNAKPPRFSLFLYNLKLHEKGKPTSSPSIMYGYYFPFFCAVFSLNSMSLWKAKSEQDSCEETQKLLAWFNASPCYCFLHYAWRWGEVAGMVRQCCRVCCCEERKVAGLELSMLSSPHSQLERQLWLTSTGSHRHFTPKASPKWLEEWSQPNIIEFSLEWPAHFFQFSFLNFTWKQIRETPNLFIVNIKKSSLCFARVLAMNTRLVGMLRCSLVVSKGIG